MAIQTSTGVRLSISSGIPASYDLAGYGALNYIDIGDVTNIPQFGAAYQTVTNSPLATGVVQKRKGFVDYGNPVIDMAMNDSSSGQQMMRAACTGIRKNQAHAFKMTYGDGSLRYWSARVFSFQELPGSSNQMVGATSSLGITRAILQVPRITLNLAFSDGVYSLNGEVKNFSDIITFNRSTTGTYINQSGVLTTAAIDEPRLSYDPATGESLGLLIEGASTNLLTYSEQFDNAAWAKDATVTVTPDQAVSPSGELSSDKVSSVNNGGVVQAFSIGFVDYSFSVFLKSAGESSIVRMGESDYEAFFDCNTGDFVGDPPPLASVDYFGGGWYRVGFTKGTSGGVLSVFVAGSGSASDFYIWGAQLEQKPYATSYIKTEASQVTRAADLASVDDLSAWYNQSEGSVFVEAEWIGGTESLANARGVLGFSDGTANNVNYVYNQSSGIGSFAVFDGIAEGLLSSGLQVSAFSKIALSLSDSRAIAVDGGYFYDQAFNLPTASVLQIGSASLSSAKLDGHIKTLSYFPAPLSQSEMELITL